MHAFWQLLRKARHTRFPAASDIHPLENTLQTTLLLPQLLSDQHGTQQAGPVYAATADKVLKVEASKQPHTLLPQLPNHYIDKASQQRTCSLMQLTAGCTSQCLRPHLMPSQQCLEHWHCNGCGVQHRRSAVPITGRPVRKHRCRSCLHAGMAVYNRKSASPDMQSSV
jgi:hypothetical protein